MTKRFNLLLKAKIRKGRKGKTDKDNKIHYQKTGQTVASDLVDSKELNSKTAMSNGKSQKLVYTTKFPGTTQELVLVGVSRSRVKRERQRQTNK